MTKMPDYVLRDLCEKISKDIGAAISGTVQLVPDREDKLFLMTHGAQSAIGALILSLLCVCEPGVTTAMMRENVFKILSENMAQAARH